MPSGNAHKTLAIATSPLLVLGAWTVFGFPLFDLQVWLKIGIVTTGYLIDPVLFSPDMDLPNTLPSNRWGLFEFIWWPYQMLVHKGGGRNPISHWPPMSAILRVVYLWLMTFIVLCFGIGIIDLVWYGLFKQILLSFEIITTIFMYWLWVWKQWWWWLLIAGITLGDALHVIADWSASYMSK